MLRSHYMFMGTIAYQLFLHITKFVLVICPNLFLRFVFERALTYHILKRDFTAASSPAKLVLFTTRLVDSVEVPNVFVVNVTNYIPLIHQHQHRLICIFQPMHYCHCVGHYHHLVLILHNIIQQ